MMISLIIIQAFKRAVCSFNRAVNTIKKIASLTARREKSQSQETRTDCPEDNNVDIP